MLAGQGRHISVQTAIVCYGVNTRSEQRTEFPSCPRRKALSTYSSYSAQNGHFRQQEDDGGTWRKMTRNEKFS